MWRSFCFIAAVTVPCNSWTEQNLSNPKIKRVVVSSIEVVCNRFYRRETRCLLIILISHHLSIVDTRITTVKNCNPTWGWRDPGRPEVDLVRLSHNQTTSEMTWQQCDLKLWLETVFEFFFISQNKLEWMFCCWILLCFDRSCCIFADTSIVLNFIMLLMSLATRFFYVFLCLISCRRTKFHIKTARYWETERHHSGRLVSYCFVSSFSKFMKWDVETFLLVDLSRWTRHFIHRVTVTQFLHNMYMPADFPPWCGASSQQEMFVIRQW